MTIGPVEYLVLDFPAGSSADNVVPALAELVDNGMIRILDGVLLNRETSDSDVAVFEFDESDELEGLAGLATLDGEVGGLIGPEDIVFVGDGLDEGSSAVLLLIEDTWAAPLANALAGDDGVLLEGARIPIDLVDDALADLPAAS